MYLLFFTTVFIQKAYICLAYITYQNYDLDIAIAIVRGLCLIMRCLNYYTLKEKSLESA